MGTNAKLRGLREELGLSQRGFARRVRVSLSLVRKYEQGAATPLRHGGGWKKTARRISRFHGIEPAELWPAAASELCADLAGATEVVAPVPLLVPGVTFLGGVVDSRELADRTQEVLATLDPREAEVLRLRFGFGERRALTLKGVGKVLGVTRERIRQIEAKALRKMRHPSRSKWLKPFVVLGDDGLAVIRDLTAGYAPAPSPADQVKREPFSAAPRPLTRSYFPAPDPLPEALRPIPWAMDERLRLIEGMPVERRLIYEEHLAATYGLPLTGRFGCALHGADAPLGVFDGMIICERCAAALVKRARQRGGPPGCHICREPLLRALGEDRLISFGFSPAGFGVHAYCLLKLKCALALPLTREEEMR